MKTSSFNKTEDTSPISTGATIYLEELHNPQITNNGFISYTTESSSGGQGHEFMFCSFSCLLGFEPSSAHQVERSFSQQGLSPLWLEELLP